ncbi:MAG TPA: hypothetical protein VE172_05995 [Stackebrandtia sp.]|jgi:hypothetical protein|nr:hypothetical protein [Stackebrandtia sp.]HZE38347.1 hypothetical protein [Stackebrandtia sp.]
MSHINNIGALVGIVLSAAFLLAGGVLLPLWQLKEDHNDKEYRR